MDGKFLPRVSSGISIRFKLSFYFEAFLSGSALLLIALEQRCIVNVCGIYAKNSLDCFCAFVLKLYLTFEVTFSRLSSSTLSELSSTHSEVKSC